jgi:glutathione synthase/RimK-type ligase-like ATP-grasp enzyme
MMVIDTLLRWFKENERQKMRHVRRHYLPMEEVRRRVDEADEVLLEYCAATPPRIGIVRDSEPVGGYVRPNDSWLRYERFCRRNGLDYGFYDIAASDWQRQAAQYDIIVWHTPSTPAVQAMAESKIYVLERMLGKSCFPSFDELWQYEHKSRASYLYEALGLPAIPTFATNSCEEALRYAAQATYPLISKIDTASKSSGVRKIATAAQAKRLIRRIFTDRSGASTRWHYVRQKDYLYLQPFVDDATFDLRIFVVDDKAFGYYRYPAAGDFRASGSGICVKKELPEEAIRLAVDTVKRLGSRLMSVDMLYSPKQGRYFIIETSLFNRIDTCEQAVVDGVAGYYDVSDPNAIRFRPGRFWLQELSLKVVVEEWLRRHASERSPEAE